MPATEIVGWMEYYSIFPFPQDRADYRIAQLCELTNQIAKGNVRKYSSWKFFMLDPLGVYDLPALLEQAEIQSELAFAEYLDAQERAENGNQT